MDQNTAELLTRDQVALEDTWDLSEMFPDDDAWEAGLASAPDRVAAAASFRGRLAEGPTVIKEALDAVFAVRELVQKIMVYASLRRDEDQTRPEATDRYERGMMMAIQAGEALAWLQPELVSLPGDALATAIQSDEAAPYRFLLKNTERERAHVLSEDVETVLAQMADITRAPSEAMSALDNADLRYGTVKNEEGNDVELTKGRYAVILEGRDRDVRAAASEAFHTAYLNHTYTLSSLHASSVKGDVVSAKLRGYESARHAALFSDNIPVSVYDNLIATVREKATPIVERYMNLRKRALGLDELRQYDLRVQLAPEPRKHYDYREGVEIVLNGVSALGDTYVNDLRAGYNARWVDVHETKGKQSGAYSWGAYGAPPVMLMNWNGTLNDVFTLAHESGHAMHTYYANGAQPIQYAGYSIFLAEIASTVNEVLLSWHLLGADEGKDDVQRFGLLNRFADTYFGTVCRQTMFAEFEQQSHAVVEQGGALTAELLSDLYADLYTAYTPGVEIDDSIRITWARIPHFYNAFYVFQYATGMSSAINLATAVRDEGTPARDRYLAMLAAGSSDYPMNVLMAAGVDLETPAPIEAGIAEFDRVISEMEALAEAGVLEKAQAQLG